MPRGGFFCVVYVLCHLIRFKWDSMHASVHSVFPFIFISNREVGLGWFFSSDLNDIRMSFFSCFLA